MNRQLPVLILVRHGKTAYNKSAGTSLDRIRGWLDVQLTEGGRAEAREAGRLLRRFPVGAIYSSDLSRAKETAQIIAKSLGMRVRGVTRALRPWNLGDFQGKPTSESMQEIRMYSDRHPRVKVPGGESFDAFKRRALGAFRAGIRIADSLDEPVVMVTHYRDLMLADAWFHAGTTGDKLDLARMYRDSAPTASITLCFRKSDGSWRLEEMQVSPPQGERVVRE
jgi:broad specificity phosphatase PhoE